MTEQQLDLFGEPVAPVKPTKRERPALPSGPPNEPTWSRYRPANPVKCDQCMRNLTATSGAAPPAKSAKFRRRGPDGTDEVLCYEHANEQRERDGLASFRPLRSW